jgi:hypothetical protein
VKIGNKNYYSLKRGTYMKIKINENCMGDRNCHKLCSEVFDYDDDKLIATVKFDEIH